MSDTRTIVPTLITAAGPAACAAWQAFLVDEFLAPSTRSVYRRIASGFLRWLEPQGIGLAEINAAAVERFLESQGANSGTKSTYRIALRHFFDTLVSRQVVASNPAGRAKRERYAKPFQPAELPSATLADEFAQASDIERQAMVDAASVTLLMDLIHDFTKGEGGCHADRELCDKTLELGERYGIVPFDWLPETPQKEHDDDAGND